MGAYVEKGWQMEVETEHTVNPTRQSISLGIMLNADVTLYRQDTEKTMLTEV